MARTTSRSAPSRVGARWPALRWQRVAVLAGVALALGLVLVLYLFGWGNHFFTRLLTSFFVIFVLLAVTSLGILPFIQWATTHWFGPSWAADAQTTPRRQSATTSRPVRGRSSSSSTTT